MRLVLQCAMCGTHHPVGPPSCSICGATGVTQMRLMFACSTCGALGLDPACAACPAVAPLNLDDDLIVAEEVLDDPALPDPSGMEEFEAIDLHVDFEAVEELALELDDEEDEDED